MTVMWRCCVLLLTGTILVSCSPEANGTDTGGSPSPAVAPALPPLTLDLGLNLPKIVLTQPAAAGAGLRPTFSWKPVPGAAGYRLVVQSPAGTPLWDWQGRNNSVTLGELPPTMSAQLPGPIVIRGCSWNVVALDARGIPIAASDSRMVGP